jgi:ABC-type phosphate/phosphonate transport system substrate-binding protein
VTDRLTGRNWIRRMGWIETAACAAFFAVTADASEMSATEASRTQFRLGFSSATFTDVNENDAKAGLKVWAQMLLKERGLPVDPEPMVLRDSEEIVQALRSKRLDAITLNTDEYWRLGADLRAGPFIGGLNDGRITEEYVLLVHRDSQIERMEGLRGHSLTFFQNSRMCLASAWLDTVLLEAGFPRATEFCRVTQITKLSKVVLPVFFRQTDACVVTRRGFKTMSELNPQVSQQLVVLVSSPELVPTGFCFRHDYNDPLKDTIVAELGRIKDSPAGMQVLTLFQSGSLEAHPISCLDSAFELLDTHHRLCGGTNRPNLNVEKQ